MDDKEIDREARKLYGAFRSAHSTPFPEIDPVVHAFLFKLHLRTEMDLEEARTKDPDVVPTAFFWNMGISAGVFLNEIGRMSVVLKDDKLAG